jgi:hypothetical protein
MNNFTIPFDIDLGYSICPRTTQLLFTLFGESNIKIIDVKSFKNHYNYEPCISSRFMVSDGGSYDYTKENYNITIHNGTLSIIDGYPNIRNYMNKYCELMN